jgi:uncharacterized protein DUF5615
LKIRFQADADLHVPIIKGLRRREPAIDFTTAKEAGLAGIEDWAVLVLSASNGRVLVTHDVSTMPEAFSRFIQEQTSPGVILISQELSYREAIEGLLRVWSSTEAEDWQNVLSFLPR